MSLSKFLIGISRNVLRFKKNLIIRKVIDQIQISKLNVTLK